MERNSNNPSGGKKRRHLQFKKKCPSLRVLLEHNINISGKAHYYGFLYWY
jgi:hypothetical protein